MEREMGMSSSAQHLRKSALWLVIISLVLMALTSARPVAAAASMEKQVLSAMQKTVKYYTKKDRKYVFEAFDWELIGLTEANENLEARKWQDKSNKTVIDYWANKVKDVKDAGALAKLSLGLMKVGYDPKNFNGVNLLQRIVDQQEKSGKIGDATYTIFNHVLAMLVLEMYDYDYNRDKAIQFLLSNYDNPNYYTDDLAFTLNVLPLIADANGVDKAQKNILKKIKDKFDAKEGMVADSPDTTIEVLIGLTSIGEDVLDGEWSKSVSYLLKQQLPDGGFPSLWSNGEASSFTTEKALMALAAINQGNSLFERFTEKELADLKVYRGTTEVKNQIKVYDSLENLRNNKEVKASTSGYTVSGNQLFVRANVSEIAKKDKPLAVLVQVMKGKEPVNTAIVEANSADAQYLTAGVTLDKGSYTVVVYYWYGLTQDAETAKESVTFDVTMR